MWWRFLIKETEFGRYMTTLICLQILKELFFANYLVKKSSSFIMNILHFNVLNENNSINNLFAKTSEFFEYEFHIWLQAFSARRHNKIRLKYSHYIQWALGCRT